MANSDILTHRRQKQNAANADEPEEQGLLWVGSRVEDSRGAASATRQLKVNFEDVSSPHLTVP